MEGWVSVVPCTFWEVGISGTRSLLELGMSRGWVCLGVGMSGILVPTPLDMGPGIPQDMVSKWVVRILLECFRICASMANEIVIGM